MKILLTFTGFQDPFAETSVAGEQDPGPVLTVAAVQPFDCVYLFSTPDTAEISAQTKDALQQRNGNLAVQICNVPLKSPTHYPGISRQLKSCFRKISKLNPNAEYFIGVSSGIPHVDASWLMLAARGEIPARILQARVAKFACAGAGQVTEIDFTNPQFPQIRPFGASPDEDGPYDFQSLCDELCVVGDHHHFLRELKTAFSMAEFDSPVLLLGETSTGKEAFARLVHCAGKRAAKPFITVIAPPPGPTSKAGFSATGKAPSPAPTGITRDASRKQTAGRCSLITSTRCRRYARQTCCTRSRVVKSSGWATTRNTK